MDLNGNKICLSEDEKEILKGFFKITLTWIKNSDFRDLNNIKLLGDIYESYIGENNLKENSNLMLFLTEIRTFESASQSEEYNQRIKVGTRMSVPVLNYDLNFIFKDKLLEWYDECSSSKILTPEYVAELNRGIAYRIRQRQVGQGSIDTKKILGN